VNAGELVKPHPLGEEEEAEEKQMGNTFSPYEFAIN
jgi:hypothetical protein